MKLCQLLRGAHWRSDVGYLIFALVEILAAFITVVMSFCSVSGMGRKHPGDETAVIMSGMRYNGGSGYLGRSFRVAEIFSAAILSDAMIASRFAVGRAGRGFSGVRLDYVTGGYYIIIDTICNFVKCISTSGDRIIIGIYMAAGTDIMFFISRLVACGFFCFVQIGCISYCTS